MEGQYVAYTCYRVDPAWRRLPIDERQAGKDAFADAIDDFAERFDALRCYTTTGVRPEVDFLFWKMTPRYEDLLELGAALNGTPLAGWLTEAVAHSNGTAILVIWILWGIVFLRLVVKAIEWGETYFVVTSQRLVLTTGLVTHKVNMMPLGKVTDMSFQRTATGRIFGYGEFIVESAGQDQALSHIRFLPYPEQLYLEVCGLIFKDKDDGSD